MSNDGEYNIYRDIYIRNLNQGIFPWKPAYYYYQLHSADEVMSFAKFKEQIQLESMGLSDEDKFSKVSAPIYEQLDKYYNPVAVLSEDQTHVVRVV